MKWDNAARFERIVPEDAATWSQIAAIEWIYLSDVLRAKERRGESLLSSEEKLKQCCEWVEVLRTHGRGPNLEYGIRPSVGTVFEMLMMRLRYAEHLLWPIWHLNEEIIRARSPRVRQRLARARDEWIEQYFRPPTRGGKVAIFPSGLSVPNIFEDTKRFVLDLVAMSKAGNLTDAVRRRAMRKFYSGLVAQYIVVPCSLMNLDEWEEWPDIPRVGKVEGSTVRRYTLRLVAFLWMWKEETVKKYLKKSTIQKETKAFERRLPARRQTVSEGVFATEWAPPRP